MISCPKCDNPTRTSELVTPMGPVMLAGTLSLDPQPIIAQVCTACGYIELYAPQTISHIATERTSAAEHDLPEVGLASVPAA